MGYLQKLRPFSFYMLSVPAVVISAGEAIAAVYLTLEQAQQVIFPSGSFTLIDVILSDDQIRSIKEKSGLAMRSKHNRVWRTAQGEYFFVDEVIGKHEWITFAVGINADGSVRQIEIMEYREPYGFQVRQKKWRRQFMGKKVDSPLKLNADIKNISGATLSCRHVTEGIKRVLAFYDIAFKN